jgi:AraC-like DNA-binding protein
MSTEQKLDRLLTTLDVRIHAFAVCEIKRGSRLVFDPMNAVVVHYVLVGTGLLFVEGREPVAFGPGSILVVPPNAGQALAADLKFRRDVPAAEHCSMLVDGLVKFDAAEGRKGDLLTICGTITATYGGSFGLFDSLPVALVEDLSGVPAVRNGFDIMLAERATPGVGTRALTEAVMKQCLVLVIRQHLARYSTASPLFAVLSDTRLSRAVEAVLQRPAAAHTLADLAALAGMSRSAFALRFTETFGQSPMDFVQKTRLHHAARLLLSTDLPVKVIAASMGYASRSHFSRAFRRAYGADPTAFRKAAGHAFDPPPSVE